MAGKQMQTAFVPETFSRCGVAVSFKPLALVPSESTVNRIAQTQLVTHRYSAYVTTIARLSPLGQNIDAES